MRPAQPRLPDAARELVAAALRPWGGPAAAIDAYEAATRASADAQLAFARALELLQPARALVVLWADLTRDAGAVQVSTARWLLDV